MVVRPGACGLTTSPAKDGGAAADVPNASETGHGPPDAALDDTLLADSSQPDASIGEDAASSSQDADVDASDWLLSDATGPVWRNNPSPFCSSYTDYLFALQVWSDARGVFLAINGPTAVEIELNGGTGWTSVYRLDGHFNVYDLNGFTNGPLVLTGGSPCGINFVSNGVAACSGASPNVWRTFVVDDQLAYAITGNRVVRYDGNYWSQFGDPLGPVDDVRAVGLWASREAVVVVGTGGRVYRYRGGASVPDMRLPSMPTDASAPADNYAVWGFASNDVWIGTAEGQLVHDDGQNFSVAWSGQGDCRYIKAMWGRDGVLFFATGSSVFRWRNGSVDTILSVPCDPAEGLMVRSLWGNSPSEVFIAVQDVYATSCGSAKLYWFDGDHIAPL